MKQVIFVCLLSLSVCLSQQANPIETKTQNTTVTAQQNVTSPKNDTKPEHPKEAAVDAATKPSVLEAAAGTHNGTAVNTTQASPVSNQTSTNTNETKVSEKNSTAAKSETSKPVEPPKGHNETTPVTPVVPAANATTADGKDSKKNETTTPKGGNVTPTAAPVEAKSRAFDGPSFIGGIILTLGLLAIGFMGFKYYKNQTERNYHTL